ncbi:MAG TPA: lysylphosphatidylglycerol synthase transmembrane domain-containing protein [Mycobacteriales bacterium]|nr:lysylphosphatidylglycerol synthase transmembrane domain-containing protein [Mycobacteriales bacterium]HVE29031.1 lysylphosphatidylglycerol synthase transmembrane domain-containing protein [Mycobacteriales bacterium]
MKIPRSVTRSARIAIALTALALLVFTIARQREAVVDALHRMGPGWFAASLLAAIIGLGFTSFAWRTIMADLGSPLPVAAGMRVFYLAQIGKYLPGAVWPFVAQMELGKALGVPRQRSAVGGLLFVGLHCATGLLVASATLPFASPAAAEHYWWVLALTPVLLVVLHPRVLSPLLDRVFWILRRPPLDRPLTLANTVRACGFLLVTWLFYGLSLLALARPLGLTGAGSLALATGAYALAWSAGVMVLGLVPAGIGVREVILAAILLPFLPAGAATAVVATSRVVQTLGDALWALFAGIALRGPMRRAEQRLRVDQPADAGGTDSSPGPATGATAARGAGATTGPTGASAGRAAASNRAAPATGATAGPASARREGD